MEYFNSKNRIKKGPPLYKVIYNGIIYGLGILTQHDSLGTYYCLLKNVFLEHSKTRFEERFDKYSTVSTDKITKLTKLEEGVAILQALNSSNFYYNRKKRELIEKNKINGKNFQ